MKIKSIVLNNFKKIFIKTTNHKDIGSHTAYTKSEVKNMYSFFLNFLKNKYILLIIMKISIYLVKTSDYTFTFILNHNDMGEAAIAVFLCAAGVVSSIIVIYYIWNIDEKTAVVLAQGWKEHNEILIKDEEIKLSEFLKLQNKVSALNEYSWSRATVLTFCTGLLFISIIFGIISFDEYREFVRYYKIANGIWNNGKTPAIGTGRYEDGEQ